MAVFQHYVVNVSARVNEAESFWVNSADADDTLGIFTNSGGYTSFQTTLDTATIQASGITTVVLNDTVRVGDATNATVDIDVLFITAWNESNGHPVITSDASVSNIDDGEHIYSRLRDYLFTVKATDSDGYSDMNYVEFGLTNSSGGIVFTVRYNVGADNFVESAGTDAIELTTGSCNADRSGNSINATFALKTFWNVTSQSNLYSVSTVVDNAGITVSSAPQTTWDVISLTDVNSLAISDSRGNLAQTNTITGKAVYFDSASDIAVPSGEADVWIGNDQGFANSSDLVLDGDGAFSVASVPSLSTVGITTYTVFIFNEGDIIGNTTLAHDSHQVTYISDRIQVNTLRAEESSSEIGRTVRLFVELTYEYDSTYLTVGVVTVNGQSAVYQDNNIWLISVTSSEVGTINYETVVAIDSLYGLNSVNQNGKSATIEWVGGGDNPTTTTKPITDDLFPPLPIPIPEFLVSGYMGIAACAVILFGLIIWILWYRRRCVRHRFYH